MQQSVNAWWSSRQRLLTFITALGISTLGGCSLFESDDQPLEPELEVASLESFDQAFKIDDRWSRNVGQGSGEDGDLNLTLALNENDGIIYAADYKGRVTAVSMSEGQRVWQRKLKQPITGAVGYAANKVLVGTRDGDVIALDAVNGQPSWTAAMTSEVLAAPAGAGNRVVVHTLDGKIYGLNGQSGVREWVFDRVSPVLSLRGSSRPVVDDDTLVAGFANGKVASFSLFEGRLQWERQIAVARGRTELERVVDIDATPVLLNDRVYIASYQGTVACLDRRTGRTLWQNDASVYAGLAVDTNLAVITTDLGHVVAYDARTGLESWRQTGLQRRGVTAPVLYKEYVVVADADGYVHVLSQLDGDFVARKRVDRDGIRSAPQVVEDDLLVFGIEGRIQRLYFRP